MSFLQCEHLVAEKPRVLTNVNMNKFFTNEDCLQTVINKLKTDKFDLLNYELEDLPANGEILNEKTRILRVKIKEPGKSGWTLLKFFLKELPDGESEANQGLFTKEGEIYQKLLPELRQYMKGKVFPDCYLAKKNELVVLEDLTLQGYKSRNDYQPYDEDHIEAVLQSIAKYHAASLVLEKKNNKSIEDMMPEGGKEIMFVQDQNSPIFDFICSSITAIESVADVYYSHYPKEICERANKLMMSIPERLKMIEKDCKFKVFSHADLWNNNIMFKYNNEGKVQNAVIFDFQLCKYAHPAFDVLQAIYLTTSNVERDEQYESLLIYYFNHISRELAEQDISIHSVTTWTEFKSVADSLRPVILAIVPVCLHFMLIPRDLVKACLTSNQAREFLLKQDRSDIVLEAMRVNEKYRKRISHSVQDLLDYLKTH